MKLILLGLRGAYTAVWALLWVGTMVLVTPLFVLFAGIGALAEAIAGQRAGRLTNIWLSYTLMDLWFVPHLWLTGMPTFVHGLAEAKKHRPAVFVANHQSFLDALVIKVATPTPFMPLGKIEQAKTPILGLIYRYNVIMVDRSSEASRKASTERLRALLRQGISLLIFPEGTMNRTEYLIKPMYDGAFRLAIEAQVPIIPMVATNNRNLWPRGQWLLRPGRCDVHYAPAIDTTGMTLDDTPTLRERTYHAMVELLRRTAPVGTVGLTAGLPPELSAAKAKGKAEE